MALSFFAPLLLPPSLMQYEILICISEVGEVPSLKIVHSLMAKYPHVPTRIFQGKQEVSWTHLHSYIRKPHHSHLCRYMYL